MNETITQTSTIVRCNSPTKNTLPSLKLLSLILYYTRSIKCYNNAQKEIQDNRLKQLQLRIKKMKYERESDQKIQEYIQEEERTYKLRFTDPFFDEDFFFSENRDILTLQILSYFISHPNQHVDEKILIAHIEKKKISAIGSIKDSPLLSDIRKIVYIMIECGIISQHVRTENVTRKILTWQMRTSLHAIITTAQTHIINEIKEDIH